MHKEPKEDVPTMSLLLTLWFYRAHFMRRKPLDAPHRPVRGDKEPSNSKPTKDNPLSHPTKDDMYLIQALDS